MNPADFGISGSWGGLRTTKGLVDKFGCPVTSSNANGEPTAWSDGSTSSQMVKTMKSQKYL